MKKYSGRFAVQNKCNRRLDISPISVFSATGILAMCILLCCFLFSHGELIERYFFYDTRDTGMDFFHSIEYVRGRTPYELFNTLYPPLANLLFLVALGFVPQGVSEKWPSDFGESIGIRGTDLDLRTYQAPMLLFLVFVVISSLLIVSLVAYVLKQYSRRQANCAAFCLLFCPGMIFAMERGNILLLVVPLIMFFVFFRNSESRIVQELALISLALAAGLKLYPAFFGILLLRDKKYKQAIRAILYGILAVILPMFAFKEGLSGIPMWLSVVFDFGENNTNPWIGTGFANILHRIALYANTFSQLNLETGWFSIAGMIVAGVLLVAALLCKKEWQSSLAVVMAVIMFQSQAGYIYSFMCIPMALFLAEEKTFSRYSTVPFLLMLLLLVHLPLFYSRDVSYPDIAVKQLISLLLVCWCLVNAVTVCIKKTNK